MDLFDRAPIGATRRTADGYLVADARIARSGVQTYKGSELGHPELGDVTVFRPSDEVFSAAAMASFTHKPVVVLHPNVPVDASNWKDYAAGQTSGDVMRDGEFLRVPLMVADSAAIKAVDDGSRELSAGYSATIVWADGETEDGVPYQATMRDIRANHIAIVPKGRAGPECRIGDGWTEPTTTQEKPAMADTLRAVLVDGVTYQFTDQAAQLVERLQRQVTDAAAKLTAKDGEGAALRRAHADALAAKDGVAAALAKSHADVIAAKDGEIAALTVRVPDAAALDARIEQRLATISVARGILGDAYEPKGRSDADIRADVVRNHLGDDMVAGKPVQWVDAAYEVVSIQAARAGGTDPLRDTLRDGVASPGAKLNDDGGAEYEKRQSERWKGAA